MGGGENNREGWKWFDISIIGGGGGWNNRVGCLEKRKWPFS